jgi:hypothetical protein
MIDMESALGFVYMGVLAATFAFMAYTLVTTDSKVRSLVVVAALLLVTVPATLVEWYYEGVNGGPNHNWVEGMDVSHAWFVVLGEVAYFLIFLGLAVTHYKNKKPQVDDGVSKSGSGKG